MWKKILLIVSVVGIGYLIIKYFQVGPIEAGADQDIYLSNESSDQVSTVLNGSTDLTLTDPVQSSLSTDLGPITTGTPDYNAPSPGYFGGPTPEPDPTSSTNTTSSTKSSRTISTDDAIKQISSGYLSGTPEQKEVIEQIHRDLPQTITVDPSGELQPETVERLESRALYGTFGGR